MPMCEAAREATQRGVQLLAGEPCFIDRIQEEVPDLGPILPVSVTTGLFWREARGEVVFGQIFDAQEEGELALSVQLIPAAFEFLGLAGSGLGEQYATWPLEQVRPAQPAEILAPRSTVGLEQRLLSLAEGSETAIEFDEFGHAALQHGILRAASPWLRASPGKGGRDTYNPTTIVGDTISSVALLYYS